MKMSLILILKIIVMLFVLTATVLDIKDGREGNIKHTKLIIRLLTSVVLLDSIIFCLM